MFSFLRVFYNTRFIKFSEIVSIAVVHVLHAKSGYLRPNQLNQSFNGAGISSVGFDKEKVIGIGI